MAIDREEFKKLLKEKGLKVTRQRLVVLEVLAENPEEHLTAEEIYERVKADNPDIGLATVYRTVQLLLELELIDRINLDDGFARYEIGDTRAAQTSSSDLFKVRQCVCISEGHAGGAGDGGTGSAWIPGDGS